MPRCSISAFSPTVHRYQDPSINRGSVLGLTGEITLSVDPFFYFDELASEQGFPALIYTWTVREMQRGSRTRTLRRAVPIMSRPTSHKTSSGSRRSRLGVTTARCELPARCRRSQLRDPLSGRSATLSWWTAGRPSACPTVGGMRFFRRSPNEWTPPDRGACACAVHVEDLLEATLPFAAKFRDEMAGEPARASAGCSSRRATMRTRSNPRKTLYDEETNRDLGPSTGASGSGDEARLHYDDDAPVQLDDVIGAQPEGSRRSRGDREIFYVDAPQCMCAEEHRKKMPPWSRR